MFWDFGDGKLKHLIKETLKDIFLGTALSRILGPLVILRSVGHTQCI